MSSGSVSLPSGTLKRNFWKFSSVGGTPTNVSKLVILILIWRAGYLWRVGNTYSPVALRSGHIELTRIFLSPYSAARPFVACNSSQLIDRYAHIDIRTFVTAALLALYQTSPGRGRVAPIEAILITEPPPPCLMSVGMTTAEQ